ncbi:MAG TPA: IS21 family transposase [Sphaerochaeta sp.]|nr:IS21 family transposase [Sphaerochaeta sp.]
MARKIKVKLILELRSHGMSMNEISQTRRISKHSVCRTCNAAKEKGLTFSDVKDMADDALYRLLFPDKHLNEEVYEKYDMEYVHKELGKFGVNLKLLHAEYLDECRRKESIPMSYSKFCRDYRSYTIQGKFTSHIVHKPGEKTEVDWSGPTMEYLDLDTGELVPAYLFVGTLPYSQYSYVEPCLDMREIAWLQCHANMWAFFGGSTRRLIPDNLKTGIIKHPKEGDIILNDAYEDLAVYYKTAIMPAGVRKPKHKPSVEGNVGNIATAIIAKLRNIQFTSFASLKIAVMEKLSEFNREEFQKREKSRYLVFIEEEQPKLNPLPKFPYEACTWYYNRKVQLNSHVAFKKNFYSCSYKYLGKKVDIKAMKSRIEIYFSKERIKTHEAFGAHVTNRYRTDQEDMPKGSQYQEWTEERIVAWASEIGANTLLVVKIIFASVVVREQGFNPALSVLKLAKKYTDERLETTCRIALEKGFKSPRYAHLNSILTSNQDIEYKAKLAAKAKGPAEDSLYTRGAGYYSNFGKGEKND